MKMQHSLNVTLIIAAITLGSAQTSAAPILIDFNDWPTTQTIGNRNVISHGITFSPSCHYDLAPSIFYIPGSSRWIGFDFSGCQEGPLPTYLGPEVSGNPARLFLMPEHDKFMSLHSFKFVSSSTDSGWYNLRSSKGGFARFEYGGGILTQYDFSGPEWTNVKWLEFDAGGLGETVGFDDLVVSTRTVNEPGLFALLSLGALGYLSRTRRARRAPNVGGGPDRP